MFQFNKKTKLDNSCQIPDNYQDILKIKKGCAVVVTKDFTFADFKYKRFKNNRKITHKGNVVFIATEDSEINNEIPKIEGYDGKYGCCGCTYADFSLSKKKKKCIYNFDYLVERIIVALANNVVEVIDYNSLPEDFKNNFEEEILNCRICNTVCREGVIWEKPPVLFTSTEDKRYGVVLNGYNNITKEKEPERFIRYNELQKYDWRTLDGIQITGDPFEKSLLK
jgi:hypothetical protein